MAHRTKQQQIDGLQIENTTLRIRNEEARVLINKAVAEIESAQKTIKALTMHRDAAAELARHYALGMMNLMKFSMGVIVPPDQPKQGDSERES